MGATKVMETCEVSLTTSLPATSAFHALLPTRTSTNRTEKHIYGTRDIVHVFAVQG